MAKRQRTGSASGGGRAPPGGRKKNKAASSATGEPAPATPPSISATERLDYVAAMVLELKAMAAQADCRVLESLLELAYQEAQQCRREAE